MKGPQKYPGASTAYWFQTKWGGDSMESNVIVWHTTEGTSLPGYDGGSQAPNFTARPDFKAKKLLWYQHFDFDISSRALVHAGAVATNTLNVCQVEIVGTCDPSTHTKWAQAGIQHLYSPELPDWAIRDLAAFAQWANANHGVPLTSGVTFKAYPGSYGTDNGVRMSTNTWTSFKGHCGHQHVPSGNVHGDPGAFPMETILAVAKGGTDTSEDPLAGMSAKDIATAVLKTDDVIAIPADWDKGNAAWTLATFQIDTGKRLRDLQANVAAQGATIGELVKVVTQLATNSQSLDPAALVAQIQAAIEKVTIHLDVPDA